MVRQHHVTALDLPFYLRPSSHLKSAGEEFRPGLDAERLIIIACGPLVLTDIWLRVTSRQP
jgi:hypothetical protein